MQPRCETRIVLLSPKGLTNFRVSHQLEPLLPAGEYTRAELSANNESSFLLLGGLAPGIRRSFPLRKSCRF
jgi:hypothetical protein